MSKINDFIDSLYAGEISIPRQVIAGRNAVARKLFHYLFQESGLQQKTFLLCQDGLLLGLFPFENTADLSGYKIPSAILDDAELADCKRKVADRYLIISTDIGAPVSDMKAAPAQLNTVCLNFESLLTIFDEGDYQNKNLLKCLDSVKNPISIYDQDAHLVYANLDFCQNMNIRNRDAAIGMHIEDILKSAGMKVYSMENNSTRMKMLDVLNTGQAALDWEVRLEAQKSAHLVSNDMYPVLDQNGNVRGLVEVMRSRHQDMTRTKKMAGLTAEYIFDDIVSSSPSMHEVVRQAKDFSNIPLNFLITGESGVGKELFAQSIHNYSSRRKCPFVALNCANFSEGLIESELFGYVGGAFTGASKNGQVGKFELADGGTLFLDEVGELPYHFQSKLLRVLETRLVTRIGSSRQIPVDVRVIAATNRDLGKMVEEGLFRQDLYYRLQVLSIEIPPLRERKEDIPILARTFLQQNSEPVGGLPKKLHSDAIQFLMGYDWPGNVRELRNVISRASVLAKSDVIDLHTLEVSLHSKNFMRKAPPAGTPEERLDRCRQEIEHAYQTLLREALDISEGNKKSAAEMLGISRKTFYRMLEKYAEK